MKVYGLPPGQDLDRRNDIARAAGDEGLWTAFGLGPGLPE